MDAETILSSAENPPKHGAWSTETIRLIRDGEMGGRGCGGGGRGRLYTYRYTVTRMTPAFKVGSDESHFNVSLIVKDKVTRQCPQTTTFEEKGEPKRIRNEVLSLTSLKPVLNWANVCSPSILRTLR